MGIIETIKKIEREEGIEEGLEKGLEKGREKGREEGIEQKNYEFVRNLLVAKKFTVAEIANFANVPESFVKKVRTTLNKKK